MLDADRRREAVTAGAVTAVTLDCDCSVAAPVSLPDCDGGVAAPVSTSRGTVADGVGIVTVLRTLCACIAYERDTFLDNPTASMTEYMLQHSPVISGLLVSGLFSHTHTQLSRVSLDHTLCASID